MRNNLLNVGDAMQANLGFVREQTAYIEAGVYRMRYPAIRYPGLIPVDYSAPEWIKTVDYFAMDIAGKAGWTADRARDLNLVGIELGRQTTPVYMADIGYDFGIEEVNQAAMLGMNLGAEEAQAARIVYERMVDQVAFVGDEEKGFEGLFNNSSVPADSAPTGDWDNEATTEDQILADINAAITGVFTQTNEVAIADTVILPSIKMQKIASTRLGDTGQTILEFIQKANAYTAETGQRLNIRGMRGLDEAGAGDTARMVAYRNSSEVLKMHIPMRHRFLPVQVFGLTYQVPGIFRLGGLDIRLPKEVRYIDGI